MALEYEVDLPSISVLLSPIPAWRRLMPLWIAIPLLRPHHPTPSQVATPDLASTFLGTPTQGLEEAKWGPVFTLLL